MQHVAVIWIQIELRNQMSNTKFKYIFNILLSQLTVNNYLKKI